MTDNRRNRVQSLPVSTLPDELAQTLRDQQIFESDIEEENYEADDETSQIDSRRPSTVAREEIAQARRLSERLSSGTSKNSSPILLVNSTTDSSLPSSTGSTKSSLFGSIYSLGGAVWSFIRGKLQFSYLNFIFFKVQQKQIRMMNYRKFVAIEANPFLSKARQLNQSKTPKIQCTPIHLKLQILICHKN